MGANNTKLKTKLPNTVKNQLKLAQSNDTSAQVAMASYYLLLAKQQDDLKLKSQYEDQALSLLLSATSKNYLWAYQQLGEFYLAKEDKEEAHKWFTQLKTQAENNSHVKKYQEQFIFIDTQGAGAFLSARYKCEGLISYARAGFTNILLLKDPKLLAIEEINELMTSAKEISFYIGYDVAKKIQEMIESFAHNGLADAQTQIARVYLFGKNFDGTDCAQDTTKGLNLIKLAAAQEYIDALLFLADVHARGEFDFKKNDKLAFEYLLRAGNQSLKLAKPSIASCMSQVVLGQWYLKGTGIEKADPKTAEHWLLLSVETSKAWPGMTLSRGIFGRVVRHDEAWLNLAQMYRDGAGEITRDIAQAIFYYQKLVDVYAPIPGSLYYDPADQAKCEEYTQEVQRLKNTLLSGIISMSSTQNVPQPASQVPAIVIDYNQFKISPEPLGEGAFSIVFHATWNYQEYAVKKLKLQHLDDKALTEFMREAEIMEKLRSEFIIGLRGICIKPQPYCLVLEYAQNGSLNTFLHSDKEINWPKKLQIAIGIGKGLAFLHMHQPQILHRDLKSMNVLLDKNLDPKLADFGLAKLKEDASANMTTGVVGTPAWMAPELLSNSPHTTASDVYSFAIVLWELARRKIPFEGRTLLQIMFAIASGERPDFPKESCSPEYYRTTTTAWDQQLSMRPSLTAIIEDLDQQLRSAIKNK